MKIATQYANRPKTTPSVTGSKLKREYHMELDKNGHKYLVEDEPSDWYGKIQSHKDECDIAGIIEKAIRGDKTALNKVQGIYMDMTNLPKNLGEAQNKIAKFKEDFEKLPAEIKRQFDNSPEVYVAKFGTKQWENVMGITELKEQIKQQKEIEQRKLETYEKAVQNLAKEKETNE